jgi:hypothetical protein
MYKVSFGLMLMLIVSCSNNNEAGIATLKSLDSTMEQSNDIVQGATYSRLRALSEKLKEPYTAEQAMYWLPKALLIKGCSDTMLQYLSAIKELLKKDIGYDGGSNKGLLNNAAAFFVEKKKGAELFERMKLYKQALIAIDTGMNTEFGRFLNNLPINYSILFNGQLPSAKEWNNINNAQALLILTKMKSQIINIEQALCEFCDKKVNDNAWHYGIEVNAAADKTVVRPGSSLTVYATATGLWQKTNIDVTIGNKKLKSYYNSLTSYSFAVPQKEGKYSVPVEIKFINPNSNKLVSVKKEVEYKVEIGGH